MEIEKKFIIDEDCWLSFCKDNEPYQIYQYYLNDNISLLKTKSQTNTQYVITIKKHSYTTDALYRDEWEENVPEWAFDLFKEYSNDYVKKERVDIKFDSCKISLDKFIYPKELFLMEIEYDEGIIPFIPNLVKGFIIEDVTNDENYYNCNLAKMI